MTRIKHKREVLQDEAIEGKETRVDGKRVIKNKSFETVTDEKMGNWQTVKWRKKWMSSVDSFLKLRKKFSIYQYFSCWDRRKFDNEVLEVERRVLVTMNGRPTYLQWKREGILLESRLEHRQVLEMDHKQFRFAACSSAFRHNWKKSFGSTIFPLWRDGARQEKTIDLKIKFNWCFSSLLAGLVLRMVE